MSTLGFADALSQDGVKYLAASPETMLAPGTPTSVAEDIASHIDDPAAMAKAIVKDTMHTKYGMPGMGSYTPAAAMDVLDLDAATTRKLLFSTMPVPSTAWCASTARDVSRAT